MYNRINRLTGTSFFKKSVTAVAAVAMALPAAAEDYDYHPSSIGNPVAITLISIAVALMICIIVLGYVVIGAAEFNLRRSETEKEQASPNAGKALLTIMLLLAGFRSMAAGGNAAGVPASTAPALSSAAFHLLAGVIGFELVVMLWLLLYTRRLLAKDKPAAAVVHRESPYTWARMWSRLNSFRPMSEERELLLDHNYDGIQELDNRLPRWWLYGFYVCILFAAAYLWRFHVSHAAPLSGQEFAMAMEKAAIEKEAYLKKAANSVDENTVTLLTAPADLSEGKSIFTANCAACHGADAQGQVGPNLTDDYWLHKGSVQEVFKTIKYGYPEKGMRSWKDDLSPAQIAKVAGFIKSLHGTHPANAKEPQGELWQDEGKVVADSTKATAVK